MWGAEGTSRAEFSEIAFVCCKTVTNQWNRATISKHQRRATRVRENLEISESLREAVRYSIQILEMLEIRWKGWRAGGVSRAKGKVEVWVWRSSENIDTAPDSSCLPSFDGVGDATAPVASVRSIPSRIQSFRPG